LKNGLKKRYEEKGMKKKVWRKRYEEKGLKRRV